MNELIDTLSNLGAVLYMRSTHKTLVIFQTISTRKAAPSCCTYYNTACH